MPTYVALLRAINVGGHTVKMDVLRQLFEEMGFTAVKTFIASGNVIFNSPKLDTAALEEQIATTLAQKLGYKVATFIRTLPQLTDILHAQPFSPTDLEAEGNVLYIAFLSCQPEESAAQSLLAQNNAIDTFHQAGREVYWLSRKKSGQSKFNGGVLEKTLSLAATIRNRNTINRIITKYG